MSQKKPDEILESMAETFRERGKIYGDNYLRIGNVLLQLFPEGITLSTPAEHNRYHLFMMIIVKLTRLAAADLQHIDSAHDLSVYGAMLESVLRELPSDIVKLDEQMEEKIKDVCGHMEDDRFPISETEKQWIKDLRKLQPGSPSEDQLPASDAGCGLTEFDPVSCHYCDRELPESEINRDPTYEGVQTCKPCCETQTESSLIDNRSKEGRTIK